MPAAYPSEKVQVRKSSVVSKLATVHVGQGKVASLASLLGDVLVLMAFRLLFSYLARVFAVLLSIELGQFFDHSGAF